MEKLLDSLNNKFEDELKKSYSYIEQREIYKVNHLIDREPLETGEDVYLEIMNWDLSDGCDNAIFEAGYIAGIKQAIRVLHAYRKEDK